MGPSLRDSVPRSLHRCSKCIGNSCKHGHSKSRWSVFIKVETLPFLEATHRWVPPKTVINIRKCHVFLAVARVEWMFAPKGYLFRCLLTHIRPVPTHAAHFTIFSTVAWMPSYFFSNKVYILISSLQGVQPSTGGSWWQGSNKKKSPFSHRFSTPVFSPTRGHI